MSIRSYSAITPRTFPTPKQNQGKFLLYRERTANLISGYTGKTRGNGVLEFFYCSTQALSYLFNRPPKPGTCWNGWWKVRMLFSQTKAGARNRVQKIVQVKIQRWVILFKDFASQSQSCCIQANHMLPVPIFPDLATPGGITREHGAK